MSVGVTGGKSPASAGDRERHFDQWAPSYDRSVADIARAETYPFAGYDRALDAVCRETRAAQGMTVLDLGVGTGNLAARLHGAGCRVCGIDLSAQMLDAARAKLPGATLVRADLGAPWPDPIGGPFDAIGSAYALHEFDWEWKLAILERAAARLAPGGVIAIADVSFADAEAQRDARVRWRDRWDADEHYWVADETLSRVGRAGLRGRWAQVSLCAGVFTFEVVGSARA